MQISIKILFLFLTFNVNSKLTPAQQQSIEQAGCMLTDSQYFKNFMDQGNMMIASTQSGSIYEHLQILAIKHLTLSPQNTDMFQRAVNEIKNLNFFKNEIDMQSTLQNKCQFLYNESTDQLEIFVIIQFINGTYESEIDQDQSFDLKIVTALKMTLTLMKLHKNGYLHGDIQPKSFFILNQYSFLLGNLQYLKQSTTLDDFNKSSVYIEESVKNVDGGAGNAEVYDVKSEIYSFGLMMKELFLEEQDGVVQPLNEQSHSENQKTLKIKNLSEMQQEQIQFFVDSIASMVEEDKSQRMDSLDTFLGTLTLVLKTYYGVMTNKLSMNRTMNTEYIFLNTIKDQSLRFRLTNAYQQRKKFINFSMLNQKTDSIVKEVTTLKPQVQQSNLIDQTPQRNFSTVQGQNNVERFSNLKDRESYFANAYLASNIDSHVQKTLYQQKEEEMMLREMLKQQQEKSGRGKKGFCGCFLI